MKKTLIYLLLALALCGMIGELVFALMPRKMKEFELPDIHIGVEK